MAVPSSMQGADYVLVSNHPVQYIEGFKGNDQVVTADDLAQLVRTGQLRYIYWSAQDAGTQSDISAWVQSACTLVSGFDTFTRNSGAPDGTGNPASAGAPGRGGSQTITIYDCGIGSAAQ